MSFSMLYFILYCHLLFHLNKLWSLVWNFSGTSCKIYEGKIFPQTKFQIPWIPIKINTFCLQKFVEWYM